MSILCNLPASQLCSHTRTARIESKLQKTKPKPLFRAFRTWLEPLQFLLAASEKIPPSMSATATTTTSGSLPSDANAATMLLGAGDVDSGTSQYGTILSHQEHPHGQHPRSNNPDWWPTQHRRIPNYRQAHYNPRWSSLTDSSREAFMINMMFRGCYLLNVRRQ